MVSSDVHCERGAGCSKKEGRRDGSVVLDGGAGLSEENWPLKELVVEGRSWVRPGQPPDFWLKLLGFCFVREAREVFGIANEKLHFECEF